MDSSGVVSAHSGPLTLTLDMVTGLASVVLRTPLHRPLAVVVSIDEATLLVERLAEHSQRDGSAIVDLRQVFREAIGRDPFDGHGR